MHFASASRINVLVVVSCAMAVAFAIRALGYFDAFLEDGSAVIAFDDAAYHARLVHSAVANFPSVLTSDPMLNHPDGARVPWPPMYDWLLALIAWCMGGSPLTVDRVLSWASPVFGALTVIPIYVGARSLVPHAGACVAIFTYAVLPISVIYSRIGNPDHHAWMALLAATYLALSLVQFRPGNRDLMLNSAVLTAVRITVVFSWSGSLLYLAIGEAALLLAGTCSGSRDTRRHQYWGCGIAAASLTPYLALTPPPLGGWFSASALSLLHLFFLLGIAAVARAVRWLESRGSERDTVTSLYWIIGAMAAVTAVLLAFPAVREGIAPAVKYLSASSGFSGNPEQVPLYTWMREGAELRYPSSTQYYGAFAYLLPLCLLAAVWLLRDKRRSPQAVVLAVWALPLGLLAIAQLRWGNDFAPAAVTCFAVGLTLAIETARRSTPTVLRCAWAVATALALVVITTGALNHSPKLQLARAAYGAQPGTRADLPAVALTRFARRIAGAIPIQPGCEMDPACRPTGIIASPRYGHLLHYAAGRPTPADPFGPQFNLERWDEVIAVMASRDESQVFEASHRLDSRYLMTDRSPARAAERLIVRLQEHDGGARRDIPALGHFRLTTEAQSGALGLQGTHGINPPYKLFEIVAGARLEVAGPPRSRVAASVEIRTPTGRQFVWTTTSVTRRDGIAILRVPYATGHNPAGVTASLYRVATQSGEHTIEVTEAEVQTGATVRFSERNGNASSE